MANQQTTDSQSRTVDIHYRRLDRDSSIFPKEISFAEALRRALDFTINGISLSENVSERVQKNIPNKPGDILCWNNIIAEEGYIFGSTCLFRPSALQAVIGSRNIKETLTAFPLTQVGEANGQEFLRAIAYWMITEDHFYLVQAPSIQTGTMRDYFEWLLKKCSVLDNEHAIQIQTVLDRKVVSGDLEDIVSVNLGGALQSSSVVSTVQINQRETPQTTEAVSVGLTQETKTQTKRVGEKIRANLNWDVLSSLLPNPKSLEDIERQFDRVLNEDPMATLGADFEFFIRSRRKDDNLREAKQKALQAIANGLQDLPDGAVTTKGKDGTVSGDDIRRKESRAIRLAPIPGDAPQGARGVLLDLQDAFNHMKVLHNRYLEDNRI